MTITLGWWVLPLLITIITWTVATVKPVKPSTGDYSFGPAFEMMGRAFTCIILTLSVWLIYFILLAIGL